MVNPLGCKYCYLHRENVSKASLYLYIFCLQCYLKCTVYDVQLSIFSLSNFFFFATDASIFRRPNMHSSMLLGDCGP